MKLTAEQIAKIEGLVTHMEECGHRSAMIEYGLRDLAVTSSFAVCLRALGVKIEILRGRGMSPRDRKEFAQWLREKRAHAGLAALPRTEDQQ